MQTIIQAVCSPGESLRTLITVDAEHGEVGFRLLKGLQAGRKPGWAKIKSTDREHQGVINLEWIDHSNILICRIINKGAGRPDEIAGGFVKYLLSRHGRRIKLITILLASSKSKSKSR